MSELHRSIRFVVDNIRNQQPGLVGIRAKQAVFIYHTLLVHGIRMFRHKFAYSKWKTLFYKYADPISWKKKLREKLFLVIIITYFNSIVVLMIAYQDVIIFSGFEHNTQLLIFIIIKTIFLSIDG